MTDSTIKILLVDDERYALELMEGLLQNLQGVKVVGKAGNKFEAISSMIQNEPDVIFQDIEMQMNTDVINLPVRLCLSLPTANMPSKPLKKGPLIICLNLLT
jgi:chemotaxis response regulator CheB